MPAQRLGRQQPVQAGLGQLVGHVVRQASPALDLAAAAGQRQAGAGGGLHQGLVLGRTGGSGGNGHGGGPASGAVGAGP